MDAEIQSLTHLDLPRCINLAFSNLKLIDEHGKQFLMISNICLTD